MQASAVPVRPSPPMQATSTRCVADRSHASAKASRAAAGSAGSRKSGQAAHLVCLGLIHWASLRQLVAPLAVFDVAPFRVCRAANGACDESVAFGDGGRMSWHSSAYERQSSKSLRQTA
jgi:hypothetical protein